MAKHEWINGCPVQSDESNFEWGNGAPYIVFDGTAVSGYSLTCESGTYLITGSDLSVLADRILTAAAGAYLITGSDVGLLRDALISIGSGSLVISGSDIGIKRGYVLALGSGTYVLTGTAVGVLKAHKITIEPGVYIISGQDITIVPSSLLITKEIIEGLRLGEKSLTTDKEYAGGNDVVVIILDSEWDTEDIVSTIWESIEIRKADE